MNDKERILTTVIRELKSSLVLSGERIPEKNYHGGEYVRFGRGFSLSDEPIKSGTLVICETGPVHDFTIGFYEQSTGSFEAIIRHIGSKATCKVSNERFCPILGLSPEQLWEEPEHGFSIKVQKAFWKINSYWYRYGGIDFKGPIATVWCREAFGGLSEPSKPFPVEITWNNRTAIKRIVEVLEKGGVGTKKFEKVSE